MTRSPSFGPLLLRRGTPRLIRYPLLLARIACPPRRPVCYPLSRRGDPSRPANTHTRVTSWCVTPRHRRLAVSTCPRGVPPAGQVARRVRRRRHHRHRAPPRAGAATPPARGIQLLRPARTGGAAAAALRARLGDDALLVGLVARGALTRGAAVVGGDLGRSTIEGAPSSPIAPPPAIGSAHGSGRAVSDAAAVRCCVRASIRVAVELPRHSRSNAEPSWMPRRLSVRTSRPSAARSATTDRPLRTHEDNKTGSEVREVSEDECQGEQWRSLEVFGGDETGSHEGRVGWRGARVAHLSPMRRDTPSFSTPDESR